VLQLESAQPLVLSIPSLELPLLEQHRNRMEQEQVLRIHMVLVLRNRMEQVLRSNRHFSFGCQDEPTGLCDMDRLVCRPMSTSYE
jgi:hypothetical protein